MCVDWKTSYTRMLFIAKSVQFCTANTLPRKLLKGLKTSISEDK
jgi:hypothetical protein